MSFSLLGIQTIATTRVNPNTVSVQNFTYEITINPDNEGIMITHTIRFTSHVYVLLLPGSLSSAPFVHKSH